MATRRRRRAKEPLDRVAADLPEFQTAKKLITTRRPGSNSRDGICRRRLLEGLRSCRGIPAATSFETAISPFQGSSRDTRARAKTSSMVCLPETSVLPGATLTINLGSENVVGGKGYGVLEVGSDHDLTRGVRHGRRHYEIIVGEIGELQEGGASSLSDLTIRPLISFGFWSFLQEAQNVTISVCCTLRKPQVRRQAARAPVEEGFAHQTAVQPAQMPRQSAQLWGRP